MKEFNSFEENNPQIKNKATIKPYWKWDRFQFIDPANFEAGVIPSYYDAPLPDKNFVLNGPVSKQSLKVLSSGFISFDSSRLLQSTIDLTPGRYSVDGKSKTLFPSEARKTIFPAGKTMLLFKGNNIAVNPNFDTDTVWTKDADITITGGVALWTNALNGSELSQDGIVVAGQSYKLTYDILNWIDDEVQPQVGGDTGVTRSANGTFTEKFVATNSDFGFVGIGASIDLSIDNVILQPMSFVESVMINNSILPELATYTWENGIIVIKNKWIHQPGSDLSVSSIREWRITGNDVELPQDPRVSVSSLAIAQNSILGSDDIFLLPEFPVVNFSISEGYSYTVDAMNGIIYVPTSENASVITASYDVSPLFSYLPKTSLTNKTRLHFYTEKTNDYFLTIKPNPLAIPIESDLLHAIDGGFSGDPSELNQVESYNELGWTNKLWYDNILGTRGWDDNLSASYLFMIQKNGLDCLESATQFGSIFYTISADETDPWSQMGGGGGDITFYMVFRWDGTINDTLFFKQATPNGAFFTLSAITGNKLYIEYNDGTVVLKGQANDLINGWNVIGVTLKNQTNDGEIIIYHNLNSPDTATNGSWTPIDMNVGSTSRLLANLSTTQIWGGAVAEVSIHQEIHTPVEVALVIGWLAAKWGITL